MCIIVFVLANILIRLMVLNIEMIFKIIDMTDPIIKMIPKNIL